MPRNGRHYLRLSAVARGTAAAQREGRQDGASPARVVHPHGTPQRYRAGCRDEPCRIAWKLDAQRRREQKANGTAVLSPFQVDPAADARAVEFLKDGTSYNEAAKSAGVGAKSLALRHPEYKGNKREWDSVMASIKLDPKLLNLHREIWKNGATT